MGADLFLHGHEILSVFELLGSKENDITYSLGWALAQSDEFRQVLLGRIFPGRKAVQVDRISLQENTPKMGITDVEILGTELHVIVEAKRGWQLPAREQLRLYVPRFQKHKRNLDPLVTTPS